MTGSIPDDPTAEELSEDANSHLPDKAKLFVQLGCVQYSGNDALRNYQRARRLLTDNPEIAAYSFYTALVANDAQSVADFLASDATQALTAGGPLAWPPLLYVTYSRIGEPENTQSSLSIVRQLLDAGADVNSHVILNDTYRFTALTGAMGEGENGVNQPPHQYADELATLLLDSGANPNEGQGLYNTMFTDSVDKWLAVLLSSGLNASDLLNWDSSGPDAQVTTLDYQLASAVAGKHLARVKWLLDAGANPNARNTYNGRAVHTNALLANSLAIVQLLEDKGATAERLDQKDLFKLACVREDDDAMSSLLGSHPTLVEDAALLHAAAEHGGIRVVEKLVALGFDINGKIQNGRTLLHLCALNNDIEQIHGLLRLGAQSETRDTSHNMTAAGFAAYSAQYDAMRLLLDESNSLLDVVCCAYLERATALVEQTPAALHVRTEQGNTVLHVVGYWLNVEPEHGLYKSVIEWLLEAGADINAKNKQDQTPVQFHLANGFDSLADLLVELSDEAGLR